MTSVDAFLLRGGPPSGDLVKGLEELRYTVLTDGIPSNSDGMSDYRIYIWLILLNAPPLRTDTYLDLVRQGASPAYTKIRNDTFRTLATDPLFRRRVTENSLTRVLNAVAWKLHDAHESKVNGWQSPPPLPAPKLADSYSSMGTSPDTRFTSPSISGTTTAGRSDAGNDTVVDIGYVQGMNVLAAPFMYAARSECEAFTAFDTFLRTECPAYIVPSMDGVHRGLRLVDEVLAVVDPKLAAHLQDRGLHASIYAFPSVLTLSACTPPLPEVLSLWDFLFAWGAHLNLLCIVAQLILIRDQLLENSSPGAVLRTFPHLQAAKVKAIAISFVSKIPDEMYERIVSHAK